MLVVIRQPAKHAAHSHIHPAPQASDVQDMAQQAFSSAAQQCCAALEVYLRNARGQPACRKTRPVHHVETIESQQEVLGQFLQSLTLSQGTTSATLNRAPGQYSGSLPHNRTTASTVCWSKHVSPCKRVVPFVEANSGCRTHQTGIQWMQPVLAYAMLADCNQCECVPSAEPIVTQACQWT